MLSSSAAVNLLPSSVLQLGLCSPPLSLCRFRIFKTSDFLSTCLPEPAYQAISSRVHRRSSLVLSASPAAPSALQTSTAHATSFVNARLNSRDGVRRHEQCSLALHKTSATPSQAAPSVSVRPNRCVRVCATVRTSKFYGKDPDFFPSDGIQPEEGTDPDAPRDGATNYQGKRPEGVRPKQLTPLEKKQLEIGLRRNRPVDETYKIHVERQVSKERKRELGVAGWSVWRSGGPCSDVKDVMTDEEILVTAGEIHVRPFSSPDVLICEEGDFVRFPKWLVASVEYLGEYEERYRFLAIGDA